ncbi:MAG: A24 family peptidase, partial [Dongiaceae bacterium]
MTISEWIPIVAALATVCLLLAAAISDIMRYRIPNYLVYAIVVTFAVATAFDFAWAALGWSLLAAVGMLVLGAGLFALGLFGGGDVKLISAMALWTGFADLPRFLLIMSAAGGLLGVVWMVRRLRQRGKAASDGAAADGPAAAPPSDARPRVPNRLPYG